MRLKDYRNLDRERCTIKYMGDEYQWYDAPDWIFELNVDRIEQFGEHTTIILFDNDPIK